MFNDDGYTINVRSLVKDAEVKRQILSDELDDLASAVKRRDEHVSREIYSKNANNDFDAQDLLISRSFLYSRMLSDSRTEAFGLLNEAVRMLVFADLEASVYHLRGLRYGASPSLASFAEEWDTYGKPFEDKVDFEVQRKIKSFFISQLPIQAQEYHMLGSMIKQV